MRRIKTSLSNQFPKINWLQILKCLIKLDSNGLKKARPTKTQEANFDETLLPGMDRGRQTRHLNAERNLNLN